MVLVICSYPHGSYMTNSRTHTDMLSKPLGLENFLKLLIIVCNNKVIHVHVDTVTKE